MKKIIILLCFIPFINFNGYAQESRVKTSEYGNTLNLGAGIGGYSGYYRHAGNTIPLLHANYELDVAKSFTLAPFISLYTYRSNHYWGDNNHPHQYYNYRQSVIPIGIKGTYYLDEFLGLNSKWDIYLAGSIGTALVSTIWDNGYYGDKKQYKPTSPLFLDAHFGVEYHINNKLGVFLDLSNGSSTLGLAFH